MILNEALELVKFSYSNHSKNTSSSKRPRVVVLDFKYPGRSGQKTYGQRKDLLGWNIRYSDMSNRKTRKWINEIDSFARLLGAEKKEKYNRIKDFFNSQSKFIRRYKREHIKGLKRKNAIGLWQKTNFDELIKFNKERF